MEKSILMKDSPLSLIMIDKDIREIIMHLKKLNNELEEFVKEITLKSESENLLPHNLISCLIEAYDILKRKGENSLTKRIEDNLEKYNIKRYPTNEIIKIPFFKAKQDYIIENISTFDLKEEDIVTLQIKEYGWKSFGKIFRKAKAILIR